MAQAIHSMRVQPQIHQMYEKEKRSSCIKTIYQIRKKQPGDPKKVARLLLS